MAYVSSVSNHTSNTDMFAKICTQIAAIGWILDDDISSTQKVFYTQGESGTKHKYFLEVSQASDTFTFRGWMYWNNTTHVGTCGSVSSSTNITYAGPEDLYIAGNKNCFVVTTTNETKGLLVGFPPTPTVDINTLTTASATAGSSVSLTVSDTTGFYAGQVINIIDSNSNGIQWSASVSSITDATHLVINTLDNNIASGSYVGQGGEIFFIFKNNSAATFVPVTDRGVSGTTSTTGTMTSTYMISPTYSDPAGMYNKRLLMPFYFYESVGTNLSAIGYSDSSSNVAYGEATVTDIFMINSSGGDETGITTSATSTTITDSTKSWTTNAYANKYVVITDGTGVSQSRKIASNTGTTLTISNAWITNPTATGTFQITSEVFRCYVSNYLYKDTF